jgi:hypothetical protein
MKAKRLIVLLFFVFQSGVFSHEVSAPLPFSYLENLYFSKSEQCFFSFSNIDPDLVIFPNLDRSYRLVRKDPKDLFQDTELMNGTTIFIFEETATKNYHSHFFHLLEHVLGIWSVYAHQSPSDVKRIVMASDGYNEKQTKTWRGPNRINLHLLKALFPHAKVLTWQQFCGELPEKVVCFERALTSDRALSHLSPLNQKWNKMLGAALPSMDKNAIEKLARSVREYAMKKRTEKMRSLSFWREKTLSFCKALFPQSLKKKKVCVTYIKRNPPRCLTPELEKRMIAMIRSIPHVTLKVLDFAKIPFTEQIRRIEDTDVLISVHGNGLSHLLFLSQESYVIEIFPPNSMNVDYRLFADAKGVQYSGIISNQGVISKEEAYSRGPFGNTNAPVNVLDIEHVASLINRFSLDRVKKL